MMPQKNNPLHGVNLKTILEELDAYYGWDGLARQINIKCFTDEPSIGSSLTFLRKTPWAREKVEKYYVWTFFKRDGTRKGTQTNNYDK
ncbi:MAG: VF530 family DNA-binding protein [Candidatus Paceibacteria bacterium]